METTKTPHLSPSGHAGFTLTELLAVLAVLALLATLPLLALTKDRLAVHQAKCAANLKQLTVDSSLYTSDLGAFLPFTSAWVTTLNRYGPMAAQAAVCPAAPGPTSPAPTDSFGTADHSWVLAATPPTVAGSYAFNGWLYSGQTGVSKAFAKPASIQKPELTPVFCDAVWLDAWPAETDPPARNLYTGVPESQIGRATISRHGGMDPARAPRSVPPGAVLPGAINIGMSDGHAETVRLQKLWDYCWHLNWIPPATRPN